MLNYRVSSEVGRGQVMSRQWKRMEAERLLLHEVACREGLRYEGTLRQSRIVDELVVELMKRKIDGIKEGLRQ